MLRGIMTHWLADYHHVLLVRLLNIAVVFGVVGPGLWLLFAAGSRSACRLAGHIRQGTRTWQGHTQ
jgi:hypothetical protein